MDYVSRKTAVESARMRFELFKLGQIKGLTKRDLANLSQSECVEYASYLAKFASEWDKERKEKKAESNRQRAIDFPIVSFNLKGYRKSGGSYRTGKRKGEERKAYEVPGCITKSRAIGLVKQLLADADTIDALYDFLIDAYKVYGLTSADQLFKALSEDVKNKNNGERL